MSVAPAACGSQPPSWRQLPLSTFKPPSHDTVNPTNCTDEAFEYYSIPAYQEDRRPTIARGRDIGSTKLLLDPGTILFGKLNPRVEKVWRVGNYSAHRKIGSTEWLPLVPKAAADAEFLYYLMWSEHVMPKAKKLVSGSTPSRQRVDPTAFYRIDVPLPPLLEQKKIGGVLSLVQKAIEQQERLIALTTELKKSLMHKLFTEGLNGEPQKETEVGAVPGNWDVATLESVVVSFDYGTSVKCGHGESGVPVLRIPNVLAGSIDLGDLKHGRPKPNELVQLRLEVNDLLFVRTNGAKENAGRCALYRGELKECYFASYLIRVRVDPSKAMPEFVHQYAQTEMGRSFLSGRAIRTADGKFNINTGTLRRVLLPVPAVDEQSEIVARLDLAEQKLKLHQTKHAALTDLFRILLHQLMTGQLRVGNVELPELVPAA